MHFETKKVSKSVIEYINEGFLHLLKHPLLYMSSLVICTLVSYFSSYFPSSIRNIFNIFFGMFVMVWIMEITFSSTKEKYNFKKYITSLLISVVGFKKLLSDIILKTSAKYALFLFILICFIPNEVSEEQSFAMRIAFLANINIITNMVIYSIWSKFIITDPLIMARMTGNLDMDEKFKSAKDAINLNKEMIFKILFLGLILTFLTILPFSNILQFIIAIALTFFSMDMYKSCYEIKVTSKEEEREDMKEILKINN